MLSRSNLSVPAAMVALAAACSPAPALPPGFIQQDAPGPWEQPLQVVFAPIDASPISGRMHVVEKSGKVWIYENGVKSATPLIDISEEVGNWRDYGLMSVCFDPNFSTNGYIYLMYVVDYHHLTKFGTPDYNPNADEYFIDTIGRITRYTANAGDGFRSVDSGSRHILMGESITTGMPILHQSHGPGTIFFGTDGTLIASLGDGASYDGDDPGGPRSGSSNTGLADGIITPAQDVGVYRSQMLSSLNGKIIRIDPLTGDGIPSNPYFDALDPHSVRSRVWALGVRNPFRMAMKPGTGSTDPADGNPGTFYFGDVGWSLYEEFNVCDGPGLNFGWPIYEGMDPNEVYNTAEVFNQEAPNPLFGTGGCTQEFFRFRELITQDTLDPSPSFPNPCDAGQQIPPAVRKFVHRRPVLEWCHCFGARVAVYEGLNSVVYGIGAGGPTTGPNFIGYASIGGTFYTGTDFPAEYQNKYFFADYPFGWIRVAAMGSDNRPTDVAPFLELNAEGIINMAVDPFSGDLYYINLEDTVMPLRRIVYVGDSNIAPTAVASAAPPYGPSPLAVQFTGSNSTDPENEPITYLWDFGDGTELSTEPNPVHTYTNDEDITALGTIVAKVQELDPPFSLGGSNPDPNVIRDGVYPPWNIVDNQLHYDTYHQGEQGNEDYIGYTFDTPRVIRGMIFQEGREYGDGGWFDVLELQARVGGVWTTLPFTIDRPYPGQNGTTYERFKLSLVTPVLADGVRIHGDPGGVNSFITVAELRALAQPASTGPVCVTAKLTVSDPAQATDSELVDIALDNSPPSVTITSPPPGAFFRPYGGPTFVPLTADITDAEHTAGELVCKWEAILHHNTHTHPEPPVFDCSTVARLDPHGSPGDTFSYEFRLTVTDPDCLQTVVSTMVVPNTCPADFNNDGFLSGDDFDAFVAAFETGEFAADFNNDTFVNGDDFDAFVAAFETGC